MMKSELRDIRLTKVEEAELDRARHALKADIWVSGIPEGTHGEDTVIDIDHPAFFTGIRRLFQPREALYYVLSALGNCGLAARGRIDQ